MQNLYDISAPKKATNLSINSDLLAQARSSNINLSATLERALREELARERASQWQVENKASIKAYNQFVQENGCFGDEYREF